MLNTSFSDWTNGRSVPSMGTNNGASELAFQEWRHFKEAFTPELVARAVNQHASPVSRCLDPFGGSGTTAIACQFLGVEPITIEVNPYLADLIESKLVSYDPDSLVRDLGVILKSTIRRRDSAQLKLSAGAPATMVEPGINGRWVFDAPVASRLAALLSAIHNLDNPDHQKLFRVLLGGILVDVSNVIVNGKGRRYRRRWKERKRDADSVEKLFSDSVRRAVSDIHRFSDRACLKSTVLRGDARQRIGDVSQCDLVVFSPPYPNTFDYTDVYNLELWVLGYLEGSNENRELRQSTLCSHVQVSREYPQYPLGSPLLEHVIQELRNRSDKLWNRKIPDMVGGYFADLISVLKAIHAILDKQGRVWAVVGDSRYAHVMVPTAAILNQLADVIGYETVSVEPFRSMRSSAQQGGNKDLDESLIVLKPAVE